MHSDTISSASAMRRMIVGDRLTQLIGVAAQLGIADLLKHGMKNIEDLARATGTHAPALYRAMRLLASEGSFAEEGDRNFRLTPLAETLQSDVPGSLRVSAIFEVSEINWLPWAHVLHSVKTGGAAFEHALGATIFDYLQSHPDAAALFDAFMVEMTTAVARSITEAYDFSGIGTLVDVGGGHGAFLASVLAAQPDMRGTLVDLPHVVSGALPTLRRAGVDGRCEIIAANFFETVPVGRDAYVLKSVLHDWSDEHCMRILANCRFAMPDDSRLLVIELDLRSGNQPDYAKYIDLNMLVQTEGGYQRTEEEHRSLFAASGFRLSRVVPKSSGFSVWEAC